MTHDSRTSTQHTNNKVETEKQQIVCVATSGYESSLQKISAQIQYKNLTRTRKQLVKRPPRGLEGGGAHTVRATATARGPGRPPRGLGVRAPTP